jgi:UDP-N-acetylglucosamine 2-epimerase (non-hydrolysing)
MIIQTGNTVVDALKFDGARAHRFQNPNLQAAMNSLGANDKVVLVTTHRRENLGKPLESLCAAFQTLVEKHDDLHLFYPVHMNPKVSEVVHRRLRHPRAHLLPALNYFDLIHLLRKSYFVLTDSGGLQEEAPSLGKPVVILRKVTERPEAVSAGVAVLAGTNTATVVRLASRLMRDSVFYNLMARGSGIYGDGHASKRIAESLRYYFGLSRRRPAQIFQ